METITAFITTHPKALILLGIAVAIRLWVNRRRFYRRGWGGLQHFSSYGKAVFAIAFEKVLMVLATLLIVAAILLFLTGH
ncbi:hypothetical protein [Mucilaginibacter polytrichastri]|uniref:Uncharacterized protein n=1 Tax=Mucilaginibacter polytrichastri TaxID=1302689 RepID=A0A1Q5ZVD6_9SPHI|nr:hypothetical protein [Mucilaginibacter polytrichastri]OKS85737.1 hypothetical protein RG47T_1183 [Mucilaginibacter polytrichastri]SFS61760.1 hypothetical protein SAMN04487890_102389 [Mucilaginibacter polytrichastri]